MDDLKRIYRQAVAGRVQALETALAALDSEPADAADSIRRVAHSLRGSGATYGFPEVTAAAAAAEDAAPETLRDHAQALLLVLRGIASAGGTARILVVDDDPEMQLLLRVILTRPGRDLDVAGSAAEALAFVAANRYTLILLDLVLPDADGRKVLIRIREAENAAATPVFILSAKTGGIARAECFALGADGFFEKPFDPEVIASAVDGLLNRGARPESELRQERAQLRLRTFMEQADEQLRRGREQGQPFWVAAFRPLAAAARERAADFLERVDATLVSLAGSRAGRADEWCFVVLLPAQDVAGATAAAHELRDEARRALRRRKGERVPAFAVGVAEAGDGDTATALVERARVAVELAGESPEVTVATSAPAPDHPILVVEDDELVASILKHRLERDGFRILHRTNGVDALEDIEGQELALVILDVKLPGMDGFELLERVRRDPRRARTPVIMLTALGSERDIVHGLELGANDYIVKPFSPVELIARIHRLLGR